MNTPVTKRSTSVLAKYGDGHIVKRFRLKLHGTTLLPKCPTMTVNDLEYYDAGEFTGFLLTVHL